MPKGEEVIIVFNVYIIKEKHLIGVVTHKKCLIYGTLVMQVPNVKL